MGGMKSYDRAKSYLEDVFAPEREKVIRDLESIRDSVQGIIKFQRFANTGYSFVGMIGGCAMLGSFVVTGGASIFATGALIGAYSGYAEVGHEVVAKSLLIKRFSDAETSLREHELTLSEMNNLLLSLKEDIDQIDSLQSRIELLKNTKLNEQMQAAQILGLIAQIIVIMGTDTDPEELACNPFEVYKLIKIQKLVEIVLPQNGKGVALAGKNGLSLLGGKSITKNVGKETVKVIATTFSVIADLNSFITIVDDFTKFDSGKLCKEAEKLDRIITKLQWDLKQIKECFTNTST